jgi:hypothetical protein
VCSSDLINFDVVESIVQKSHSKISAFFKECIEQNLLINLANDVNDGVTGTTTYFATTLENAQVFEKKFQDLSTEFSMKNFWNSHGYDINISTQEIDFDQVDQYFFDLFEILNEDSDKLWNSISI